MRTETVTLSTPDGPMDAYVASPDVADGVRRPAVVVIQEAFGVNGHVRSVCERLANEGYVALAPELFHRDGRGLTFGYDQFPALRQHFVALTNEHLVADVNASLAALRARPDVDPARVAIMGECIGGFVAFLAACSTDVRASLSFYGGGIVHERPGLALKPVLELAGAQMAPTLCLFGADDQGITPDQVEAIRTKLAAVGTQHEVVVYANAGHGFFCEERSAYAESAAKEAWPRALGFLRAHGV